MTELIEAYQPAADALRAAGAGVLSPFERSLADTLADRFVAFGAPEDLARLVAQLTPMTATIDIADLVAQTGWPIIDAAELYHRVGSEFGFDRLRAQAQSQPASDSYERAALRSLIGDLGAEQSARTRAIAQLAGERRSAGSAAAIETWSKTRRESIARAGRIIQDIEHAGEGWSFAKLTLAHSALRAAG